MNVCLFYSQGNNQSGTEGNEWYEQVKQLNKDQLQGLQGTDFMQG